MVEVSIITMTEIYFTMAVGKATKNKVLEYSIVFSNTTKGSGRTVKSRAVGSI